jgi:DNA-binding NarL/FixJ family response regulator
MDKAKIKVMLVDDHIVVRAGFRMLLASQNYIGEIVDIDRGELAVNEYKRFAPDVVVMDLSMPGIGGLEAIRRLYKHDPQVLILVYSIHDENIYVERALQAGARGYICKNSAAVILAEAVSLIASGKRYIESGLLADNNQSCLKERKRFRNEIYALSPREFDVFRLISKGFNAHSVAQQLCLSYKTICNYNTQIKNKLNARTSADLAIIAREFKII